MKPTKYRAWYKHENIYRSWENILSYKYNERWFLDNKNENYINCIFTDNSIILEEYTGLKDFNDVEIYENDILKCERLDSSEIEILVVKNSPGQFSLYDPNCCDKCKNEDGCTSYLSDWIYFPNTWKITVIGNINMNKDLIKKCGYYKN